MLDALHSCCWCELCALLADLRGVTTLDLDQHPPSLSVSILDSGNNAMLCFCKSRVQAFSQAQLLAVMSEVTPHSLDSHHPYLETKEQPL